RLLLDAVRIHRHRDAVVGIGLVPDEPLVFPVRRPGDTAVGVHVLAVVRRAAHDGLAAAAQVRLRVRDVVQVIGRYAAAVVALGEDRATTAGRVPDHVVARGWDVDEPGVTRRGVLQVVAVVPPGQDRGVLVASVTVGLPVAHAVRPALVTGRGDDRRGLVLRRSQLGVGFERVRADPGG